MARELQFISTMSRIELPHVRLLEAIKSVPKVAFEKGSKNGSGRGDQKHAETSVRNTGTSSNN